MRSRAHQRCVHEEGYGVERRPDGALEFRHPRGWLIPDVPAPLAVSDDSVQTIRAKNAAEGIAPDAQTAKPGWLGERLNVAYAIAVLHPRARKT